MLLSALDNKKQEQVVLASQRYGRGKALALPIQDSWQWRMTPKLPVTDTTYATFWRRLARWLVDDVPDKVMLTMTQDRVDPGQPMKLTAEVLDPQYNGINDARVVATVTSPSGKTTDVPLEWTVEHDGEYRSSVVPDEEGLYTVRLGRVARVEGSRQRHGVRAIHVGRQRVLRRDDAGAAAAADRGGDRRPLLHQRRLDAARSDLATADAA